MKNLDSAKLQLKRSLLLKRMRMGLVNLLLTSDERTADEMTEAIFVGLVFASKKGRDKNDGKQNSKTAARS